MKYFAAMLFCKPSKNTGTLCERNAGSDSMTLRSLNVKKDRSIIHRWHETPSRITKQPEDPNCHCFIALINELIVAVITCSDTERHELSKHVHYRDHDLVLDVQMNPSVLPIPGFTLKVYELFFDYLLQYKTDFRVFNMLEIDDHSGGKTLRDAGFRFVENFVLASVVKSIYMVPKTQLCIKAG